MASPPLSTAPWPVRQPALERELASPSLRRRIATRLIGSRRRLPPGVYILTYHSVVDARSAEPWEHAYAKARTSLEAFRAQLLALTSELRPIPLADAPAAVADGPSEPLLAVTFDDAYANVARGAADTCEELGISATVFANADFCSQDSVYYRVLLAQLVLEGHAELTARIFREHMEDPGYTAATVFDHSKNGYVPGKTEDAAAAAWREAYGGAPPPRAHLTFDELRSLVERGWTVGNHTRSHSTLAALDPAELDDQISGNEQNLAAEGLRPLPWLAFPNGLARHVGPRVGAWLEAHPGYAGAHAGGGVNFVAGGREWFRIPVLDEAPSELRRTIVRSVEATRRALAAVESRVG